MYEEAPALAEQLGKFPALKHLDVSANPGLDFGSISLIIKALSGRTRDFVFVSLPFFFYAPTFFYNALMFPQERQSSLNSTLEASASTACPMISHSIRPISKS